ncbi:MAG: hypothetical protein ABJN22_13470 [Litorimonas sp.]
MSGKSKEEVAFELVSKLKGVGVWGENNMQEILNMYAECLEATSGLRELDGKTPSALRLSGQNAVPAKAAPAPAPATRQSAPMQQARAQQPVLQQQQQQQRQPQQVAQAAYQQQRPQ